MLVAYTVALDLIRALRPVVEELRAYSPDAANQIERAATSIVHNLAEGERRSGRDPRRFYAMAHGSAGETRGALLAAEAWGWAVHCQEAQAVLDRELGLLYGLTRRSKDGKAPPKPGAKGLRPPPRPRTAQDFTYVAESWPPEGGMDGDENEDEGVASEDPPRLRILPRKDRG